MIEKSTEADSNYQVSAIPQIYISKTEFMIISSRYDYPNVTDAAKQIKVGDAVVQSSDYARDIGAMMDSRLNMNQHVNSITSIALATSTSGTLARSAEI